VLFVHGTLTGNRERVLREKKSSQFKICFCVHSVWSAEYLIERALVAAIGHVLQPQDFAAFMSYNHRQVCKSKQTNKHI
jgi:hypothetical protein